MRKKTLPIQLKRRLILLREKQFRNTNSQIIEKIYLDKFSMQKEDHFYCCGVMGCYSQSKLHFTLILRHLKVSSIRLNDTTKVLIFTEPYKEIRVSKRSVTLELFAVSNFAVISQVFLQFTAILFQFSKPKLNYQYKTKVVVSFESRLEFIYLGRCPHFHASVSDLFQVYQSTKNTNYTLCCISI